MDVHMANLLEQLGNRKGQDHVYVKWEYQITM